MNNPIPKAAFFDIDGTLVPYDTRCISQADCEAIEALSKQGTLIFIVTGRHICDIDNIPFPVDGAVCCNGALTYITEDGRACFNEKERFVLADEHPIPERQAMEIARIIAENQIPSAASTATGTLFSYQTKETLEFIRRINMPLPKEGNIFEAALNGCVYSFNAFVFPEKEKILFKDVLQGLDTSRWCEEFCDINIQGLDKVLGIKKILDTYNIAPADIIAFGDGINDIEMLKYAGCGIAMGTATDEVKSASDFVTASANDCGVSKWLILNNSNKRDHEPDAIISDFVSCLPEYCKFASPLKHTL